MADPELDVPAPIQALAVIREEHIQFYDDELTGAQVADGTVYIPLRPICDYLQLNWSGQRQRTLRDAALAETVQTVEITTNQGLRPMFCLPLEMLPGWLFGLNENKVRPDLQAKVKRYRRECFTVLWRAFGPQRTSPLGDTIEPRTGAELALEIAEAVAALARQQVDLEGRYTTIADYMRSHVVKTNQTLRRHEERLAGQEDRIAAITTEPWSSVYSPFSRSSLTALGGATASSTLGAVGLPPSPSQRTTCGRGLGGPPGFRISCSAAPNEPLTCASATRSCGRFGPATLGSTWRKSRLRVSEYAASALSDVWKKPCAWQ